MTHSTLKEKYPDSENPFDFRPPNKLTLDRLYRLRNHIVNGLKIETEQGVESVEDLVKRVRSLTELALRNPNAKVNIEHLPECLQDSVLNHILSVRASSKALEKIGSSELSDEEWIRKVIEEGIGHW